MISISADLQSSSSTLRYPRICYETRTLGLLASSVTVSSEDVDGPKDAPLRPDTEEYWEPTSLPASWQVNLGSQASVDYVGIAGHTLGSTGCSVIAEVSTGAAGSPANDLIWVTLGSASPTDDFPILFLDAANANVRHLRLRITGSSPAFIPRIAVIYVGSMLTFERGVGIAGGFSPPNLSRETTMMETLSNNGNFLGQSYKRKGVRASMTVRGMTPSWYRSTFDPFVKHARRYPYFLAWNPLDYSYDVVYGWTSKDIMPNFMGEDPYMQVNWEIRGTGHD